METLALERVSISDELREGRKLINQAKKILAEQGIERDFDDWLTIKNYCKRFSIKDTEIVMNWIDRGIIPAENIRVVEELNNIRLVKAVKYR